MALVVAAGVGVTATVSTGVQSALTAGWHHFFPGSDPAALTVDVKQSVVFDDCKPRFYIAKSPRQVPVPPSGTDAYGAWAARVGAVPMVPDANALVLQSASERAVVLTSMQVVDVERSRNASGRQYWLEECGGFATPRNFDVRLGTALAIVPRPGVANGGRRIPAFDFPFKVSQSDPEIFYLVPDLPRGTVTWRLKLNYTADGMSRSITLPARPLKPFRVSAAPHETVDYLLGPGGKHWLGQDGQPVSWSH